MNETMMPYEETIDLKDLCIYILRKWKGILLAVAVGAVALGGYKAVSDPAVVTDSARVAEIQTLVAENQTEIAAKQAEMANIAAIRDTIVKTGDAILAKEKEIQNQKNSLKHLNDVLAAHESSLKTAQDLLKTQLSQELKVELTSRVSSLQINILNTNNQIIGVEQRMETLEEEIATLEEDRKEYMEETDMDLKKCKEAIEKLEASIEDITEENTKLAKENTTITVPVSAADIVKFVILGAVAGGFVVCGIAFVQYFMDKKLRRVDELKERYGMRILGDFYAPVTKKNVVDQLLDRMEGIHVSVDTEKEAALAAAKVQVLAPVAGDKQQIIVTGTVAANMLEAVAGQIGKKLPAEYEICVVQSPVYDAEALLAVRQGTVVLVEGRGVSVKKEIAELVDILSAAKAKVLGVVLQ